jgi:hypothetical protein
MEDIREHPPYMGFSQEGFFEHTGDFSPIRDVYPQNSTSYPQLGALRCSSEKIKIREKA